MLECSKLTCAACPILLTWYFWSHPSEPTWSMNILCTTPSHTQSLKEEDLCKVLSLCNSCFSVLTDIEYFMRVLHILNGWILLVVGYIDSRCGCGILQALVCSWSKSLCDLMCQSLTWNDDCFLFTFLSRFPDDEDDGRATTQPLLKKGRRSTLWVDLWPCPSCSLCFSTDLHVLYSMLSHSKRFLSHPP